MLERERLLGQLLVETPPCGMSPVVPLDWRRGTCAILSAVETKGLSTPGGRQYRGTVKYVVSMA